jgi:proteasome assembly chaperone (PAC2) family protein
LIDLARDQGVERLFTFAAMATEMKPGTDARVFAAATQQSLLDALGLFDVQLLDDGHVGGLNGVLLAAAAEKGMPGVCLLGEMPHILVHLLYPKASLAVLRVFLHMAKIVLVYSRIMKIGFWTCSRHPSKIDLIRRLGPIRPI